MRCPYCNHPDSRVIDSRDAPEGVRRRRECSMCGLRFTTYERVQTTALMVAKRDGRREEYNRDKLTRSVQMACVKRPLPTGTIDKLADDIETQLQALGRAEIPSFAIGEMVGDWAGDPLLLVIATSIIFIVLGMFLDPIGCMLLALPLILPMFMALELDLIWLGVLVIKYLEIGLITPPVGMNVYVIKSVVGDEVDLETIFKGVVWFLICEVFILALLIGFPAISTYLPSLME